MTRYLTAVAALLLLSTALFSQQQPTAPTGVLSGKVSDEAGQPAQDTQIQIYRAQRTPQGMSYQSVRRGTVDDRGEFRLYEIPAGSYFFTVGVPPGITVRKADGSIQEQKYAFQFYPGVLSVDQAVRIDVAAGAEARINMKALPLKGYKVRGSILDATTGKAPDSRVQMKLIWKDPFGNGGGSSSPPWYEAGTFEIPSVPPGDYVIQAQIQIRDAAALRAGEAAWATFPTGRASVSVLDKDVEKVALLVERPGVVKGRVRAEDATVPLPARIYLEPKESAQWSPPAANVQKDGTFEVIGVLKNEDYTVSFQGPRDMYAKSIQYDGADVLNRFLPYAGSDTAIIDVKVSSAAANLTGTVTNALLQPITRAVVVLMSDQRSQREPYYMTATDENGRFQFPVLGVVRPGDYKAFAWEGIEPYAFLDPAFVQDFEALGKPVRLNEGSNPELELRVIPKR